MYMYNNQSTVSQDFLPLQGGTADERSVASYG